MALSDIHGRVDSFSLAGSELSAADVVVLAGDLTTFGKADACARVVEGVRRFNPRVLAITGNCDHPECETYLTQAGMALHRRHVVIDGIAFVGLSGSLPCPVRTLQEANERQLGQWLDDAVQGLDTGVPKILVSHEPPQDTAVDFARTGEHAGSAAVRRFIERHQPLICFTGHIHEGRGMDRIGNTTVVNPGAWAQGGFAVAEVNGRNVKVELRSIYRT